MKYSIPLFIFDRAWNLVQIEYQKAQVRIYFYIISYAYNAKFKRFRNITDSGELFCTLLLVKGIKGNQQLSRKCFHSLWKIFTFFFYSEFIDLFTNVPLLLLFFSLTSMNFSLSAIISYRIAIWGHLVFRHYWINF